MATKQDTTPTQPTTAKTGRKRIAVERRTARGVKQAKCRYCGKFHPETPEFWFSRQAEHADEGKLYLSGRCRSCESQYRSAKREELKTGEREVKPRKASETAAPAKAPAKASRRKATTRKPARKAETAS